MTRIRTSGAGAGSLTEAEADLLYVKKIGDTMTGTLIFSDATQQFRTNPPVGLATGQVTFNDFFHSSALPINYASVDTIAFADATDEVTRTMDVTAGGPGGSAVLRMRAFGLGGRTFTELNGDFTPNGDNTWDLGRSATRWRDLYLSRNLTDGAVSLTVANAKTAYDHSQDNTQAHSDYLLNNAADEYGGTLNPDTDAAYDLGTSTKGVRQLIFSDDQSAGSNRGKFRGCKSVGSGADFYWGLDDVFPGFYVQKSVIAGSTVTDNSEDYTNLYQGDSTYKFIALNYGISRTVDANGNPTNGTRVSDAASTAGTPIIFLGGGARLFELYMDQPNSVFRMECGKTTTTRIPKLEIRLAGTGPAIRPYLDDSIDLGESALEWKDLFIDGTAAIDICRVDEQLIVPSGTADPASTVGSLFLRTDLGANGTLRMFANGAWRTVAAL